MILNEEDEYFHEFFDQFSEDFLEKEPIDCTGHDAFEEAPEVDGED